MPLLSLPYSTSVADYFPTMVSVLTQPCLSPLFKYRLSEAKAKSEPMLSLGCKMPFSFDYFDFVQLLMKKHGV